MQAYLHATPEQRAQILQYNNSHSAYGSTDRRGDVVLGQVAKEHADLNQKALAAPVPPDPATLQRMHDDIDRRYAPALKKYYPELFSGDSSGNGPPAGAQVRDLFGVHQ